MVRLTQAYAAIKNKHHSAPNTVKRTLLGTAPKKLQTKTIGLARKTQDRVGPALMRTTRAPFLQGNASIFDFGETTLLQDGDDDDDEEGGGGLGSEADEGEDWEEGKTLVDNLKLFDPESEDSLEDVLALADDIGCPMAEQAKELQQDMIEVLVPAMDHIRLIHGMLEASENKYTQAIFKSDEAAVRYQEIAAKSKAELQDMLQKSHQTLHDLFTSLKVDYARRAQLYVDFRSSVKEIDSLQSTYAAESSRKALFEDCPAALDDLHTKLDKKGAALVKPDRSSKSEEMLLKSMMARH